MSEPVLKRPTPHSEPPERAHLDSDAALGQRLKEDPHASAADLYDRFAADVNRWVWRLLGADADHGDVVQQVFVRAIRSAKGLREPERLASWVRAITVNTVYAELRRREVRRFFSRSQPQVSTHADFVREVEVRDLLLRAKAIVQRLPPGERIVFLLHHVEGHTLAEVGQLCGFSQTTAKRRLRQAHSRIARLTRTVATAVARPGREAER